MNPPPKQANPYSDLESETGRLVRTILPDIKGFPRIGRWKKSTAYQPPAMEKVYHANVRGRKIPVIVNVVPVPRGEASRVHGGHYSPSDGDITILTLKGPDSEQFLEFFHQELTETIRHELEHAFQGLPVAAYKEIPALTREDFQKGFEIRPEVEAYVTGMYMKAKKARMSFWDLMDDFMLIIEQRYSQTVPTRDIDRWRQSLTDYALDRYPEIRKQKYKPREGPKRKRHREERAIWRHKRSRRNPGDVIPFPKAKQQKHRGWTIELELDRVDPSMKELLMLDDSWRYMAHRPDDLPLEGFDFETPEDAVQDAKALIDAIASRKGNPRGWSSSAEFKELREDPEQWERSPDAPSSVEEILMYANRPDGLPVGTAALFRQGALSSRARAKLIRRKGRAWHTTKLGQKRLAGLRPARREENPSADPIAQCQKLWEHYCTRPGKKRLKAVLAHLEGMKASTSAKVKLERRRCLRAANQEAKELGL